MNYLTKSVHNSETISAYFTPARTARLPPVIQLAPSVKITNPELFIRAQLARMEGKGQAARIAEWHLLLLKTRIENL